MDSGIDKYEELLDTSLKSALKDDIESLDYFKGIKYIEPNFKSYKNRARFFYAKKLSVAIASMLVIIVVAGFISASILNGTVSASRFRMEQQLTVIKNNLTNSKDYHVGSNYISIIIDNLNQLEKARKFFPKLFIPQNIPARFEFQSLEIKKMSSGLFQAGFLYLDKDGLSMSINQETINEDSNYSVSIVNISKKIKKENGIIYISENPFGDGANTASYIRETEVLDIDGFLSVEEILDIYN